MNAFIVSMKRPAMGGFTLPCPNAAESAQTQKASHLNTLGTSSTISSVDTYRVNEWKQGPNPRWSLMI